LIPSSEQFKKQTDGLIEQWGIKNNTNDNMMDISLPISYSSTNYSISVMPNNMMAGGKDLRVGAYIVSASTIHSRFNSDYEGHTTLYWNATGY